VGTVEAATPTRLLLVTNIIGISINTVTIGSHERITNKVVSGNKLAGKIRMI